jgi:enoyl-CoA hydratase/carnithine racemase
VIDTSDFQDIQFQLDDGVALITLDRPDHMNAFSGPMGRSLGNAYTRCDADDEVRVIVVTGAGRAFCAGADMGPAEDTFAAPEGEEFSASAVEPPAFMLRKPVVAAVNGHAVGLGFTLSLQCDIRILAEEGKYGVLQVQRGVMPDAYAHWTLPRIVGMSRAAEVLLTGSKFTAARAYELGMASRVLPAAEVLPAALELAREIATQTAPVSVAVTKKLMWESFSLSPQDTERKETALHHVVMGSPDSIEGVMAFIQKRRPAWKGSVARDFPDWPE